MKIHETTTADGALSATHLRVADGVVEIAADGDGAGALALPDGAIERVMTRYGAPVEEGTKLTEVDAIDLGGARLRHVRHLARYDVIAKDWLLYERDGEEPICALANTVAAALVHLARVAARTPDSGS